MMLLRMRLERYIGFSVEEGIMTRDRGIPLLGVVDLADPASVWCVAFNVGSGRLYREGVTYRWYSQHRMVRR